MILTPLNIQVAIIKAFYALAKKSVKYYTGLALGKNNTCLFKEIRLLRAYVEILKNFEIVGSTITCDCCVDGEYTVLLNELTEFSEARIQFNCDGTGGMFFDNQRYPFTYGYSDVTSTLIIRFDALYSNPPTNNENTILPLQTLTFQPNCDFEPNTVSPMEVATTIPVNGIPVTTNYVNILGDEVFDWDGEMFVTNETLTPATQNIPIEDLIYPNTIVDNWNAEWHPTNNGWLLNYSSSTQSYTMLSPFDGVNYANTYVLIFEQYQGGNDSNITFEDVINTPWVTQESLAYTELDIPDTFVGKHAASTTIIPQFTYPFVDTPVPATTTLLIPTNTFDNPGSIARFQFNARDTFFKSTFNQCYIYNPTSTFNWSISPSSLTPFADIETFIAYVNSVQLLGYTLELVDSTTTTYPANVPAFVSFSFIITNTFADGDVIELSIYSGYYNVSIFVIGSYTVLPGDTKTDIVNGLVADVISQDLFDGTVTTDITNTLYFTAPIGSGSDWNSSYNAQIKNVTVGYLNYGYFDYGHNLIENNYVLAVIAPAVGVLYNDYDAYVGIPNNTDLGPLIGGTDSDQQPAVDVNDYTGSVYSTEPNNFTSIDDFVLAFNAASTTQAAIIGTTGAYTQVEFTAPLSNTGNVNYNSTLLFFQFNKITTAFNSYSGGVDTTEGTYILSVYDSGGGLQIYLDDTFSVNYSDLEALADAINNNVYNTYLIASVVNNELVLTTILESSFYNNYYAVLEYDYTSIAYENYQSNQSPFAGGVDQVSNPFTLVDTINNTIFSQTLDSYSYNDVTAFAAAFTSGNGLGYLAQVVGDGPTIPGVLAQAGGVINTSTVAVRNEIGVSIGNAFLGVYVVPSILPSNATIITELSNIINNSYYYDGSSVLTPNSITPTGLLVTAPPNTYDGYNGVYLYLYLYQYVAASVTFTFTTGGFTGDSFVITTPDWYSNLPICTLSSNLTAQQLATLYATLINSTTATNGGYTASFPSPAGTLVITAPLSFGSGINNTIATFTSESDIQVANFTPLFGGGDFTFNLMYSTPFAGGKSPVTTTTVRFIAPPQPLSPPFTGTSNYVNNDETLTYNYNSGEYTPSNNYANGIDTTEGKLFLQLGDDPATESNITLYEDLVNVNYGSTQELIDAINNAVSTNYGFSAELDSNNFIIYSPDYSFNYYNNSLMELAYTYRSPQYYYFYNYDLQQGIIDGVIGVNPTLVQYSGTFQNGDIGPFITDNPCTPTTVTQTCLSNSQVSKIITHIDKLAK